MTALNRHHRFRWALAASLLALAAAGCNVPDRLSRVGKAPDMNPIRDVQAPKQQRSISVPVPDSSQQPSGPNSLWRVGAKQFFRDQRASRVGDILTVVVRINDQADIENETERTRNTGENANLSNFLGFENELGSVLPDGVNPGQLAQFGSDSEHSGEGEVDRSEDIEVTMAAIVKDVLPNGNLVIEGRQEVRVNFEVRELVIAGIVRPEDISAQNTIEHSQIAEARVSYGGRGQLTEIQQPRYGQQIYDILFPF